MSVETCTFKALLEVTASSKGNLSVQLKKLNEAGLIKIEKYFQKSYPGLSVNERRSEREITMKSVRKNI